MVDITIVNVVYKHNLIHGRGDSVQNGSATHLGSWTFDEFWLAIWVCLKMLCTPKPNGFADHYPYEKWLFHWEYTLFSDKPIYET